jgi:hypothetical protein
VLWEDSTARGDNRDSLEFAGRIGGTERPWQFQRRSFLCLVFSLASPFNAQRSDLGFLSRPHENFADEALWRLRDEHFDSVRHILGLKHFTCIFS